ncbi:DUF4856 domain-containing protein [Bradymonas sediminis]|uniref:DUF4856 domain-containing protein n=1 Tax=Bradymonas sediminis TaxID=1548548 RepID=A0A2Z4FNF6_9DELT|nr:DUF4856 domain-containing protein [Bradymonas sediminis]AWV90412.1 DUF4856 domain-containing protein [Bradymonas sediminis]TDP72203.1 uncharacterized protein DUF4856 [Bradymonas sediminis]
MFMTPRANNLKYLVAAAALVFTAACADDNDSSNNDTNNNNGELQVPDTYNFDSRFVEGESSVSYSGQIFRQVLIADLKGFISGMSDAIDSGDFAPAAEGDVVGSLDFYFRFDSAANGDLPLGLSADPALKQATYNDISSGKDLVGKLAGNDSATDHKDWSTEFVGWSDTTIAANGGSVTSPEGLVTAFFATIEANALARVNGTMRTGTDGQTLPVYVTEQGQDLNQLVQKFLLMGVTYSQAADDYLDSGTDGKGLEASNTQHNDSPYSTLEHQWDEGFGYFGAARDYLAYSDEEIANPGFKDTNNDGAIDLKSEYNFANAVYAAKRDLSAVAATDYTAQAMEAFLTGRAIISSADGELSAEQKTALEEQRDIALMAWENTMAANVVHYINDTLQAMGTFGTEDYDFVKHAKVWSEMKGFALGLQFNPNASLSDADFAQFHVLVGDAPVLATADQADIDQYKADLVAARQIIGDAHGFAAENLGDADGEGGW